MLGNSEESCDGSHDPHNLERREDAQTKPVWCVVANVLYERPYGPGGIEKRLGTKHFSGGSKVHVIAFYWGMGAKSVTVIGRHRKSKHLICLDMRSKDLCNWRVELAYSTFVIRQVWERGVTEFWIADEKRWLVGPDSVFAKLEAERIVGVFAGSGALTQEFRTRPPAAD